MVISEIATLLFYVISIAFLPEYFGTFSFGRSMMAVPCLLALQIFHLWSPYDSCGS